MTKFSPQRPRGFIRGFTHRLRFHLERLVLRGLGFRLLIAAVIVAVVALVAGELAVILVPELSDPGSAIWWAFLRLTDPGYLGDDQGIAQRTISTVVTVLGYVLFLGLLIAILTQWLNQFITKLESGVSPVAVSDHIVLLGWTHRTPTIVKQLLRSGKRAERFLKKRGARTMGVVILAENTNQDLMNELKERLGPLWNDRQVMMRSGTPLLVEHLERVAFREAAVLILPGADFAEQSPGVVDAETIKTLLSVSKHIEASGSQYPLVVAGLFDASRSAIARKAYSGDNEIVANFGHPAALEGLKPERYDNILIVARESMSDEAHADAASASTYLMLRSLLPAEGRGPELTVELLEKENLFLFDDRVDDVIVSPLLISYFMSQIALRREMAAVFSEISDTWGAQIILEPAADFVPTQEPVQFSDIENAYAERGLIALGLQQGSGVDTRLELNPDQDSQWKLVSDDKVVVLATFEK